MEELIKISKILNGYRIRQVDIIGNDGSTSRYSEFFKLLKEGKIKTDTEAAQHFYGAEATDRSFSYKRFKNTFRERLINTLFFIDVNHPNFNDLETATMNIQKEWAAINILFAKGDQRIATELAEHLLPTAIKYELSEIVVYIADRLKNAYGGQIGNRKKYTYYKWLQKEQMAIWQAEIQAKDLYQELRMYFIKSTAHKPFVTRIAETGLTELQPALEKYNTVRLIYYAYISKIAQYTAINDYETALKLSDEAINAIKEKPFEVQRLMNSFVNQKLVCYIQLKQYEKGQTLIKETLVTLPEGSLTWFKTLEHSAVLAFHTKQYTDAYAFYTQAKAHPQFKSLQLRHLEIWHLYRGYLYFLISRGKIKGVTIKTSGFDDFKLARFESDVATFGRDSAGMNIAVLTVKFAMQLLEKKFSELIDNIDALQNIDNDIYPKHMLYIATIFLLGCLLTFRVWVLGKKT